MTLLFDIDGVINKSPYFTIQYEKDFGVPITDFDSFFQTEFNPTLVGKKKIENLIPPYFDKWKWRGTTEEFINYWFRYDVLIDMELIHLIQHYRALGIRVGIASQQEERRKGYLLNESHLSENFDVFYFSCDVGYYKTQPEFYNYIRKEELGKIYFWDDTQEVVDVANQNGIMGYHYTTTEKLNAQLKEIIHLE